MTANQIAEVNQLRIQAELHRLEQEARHAEKRASMAETAANQLYQQRMATPMHVVQHLSQNAPPPPPPPPPAVHVSVTGGLTPDAVAAAMQQAMTADRRSVQELVERQPFYAIRLLGGVVFFAGMVLMAVNVYKTIVAERDTHGDDNVLQAA